MDILKYNKASWDQHAASGDSPWSQIVPEEKIEQAKSGGYVFGMGPAHKPLPGDWLGDVRGKRLLCLGGGGGQQAPILAAMGAQVTVVDLSDEQLARDRLAAERYNLDITTQQGDMADLSQLAAGSFELIVNPASTMFVPDLAPVWRECARVLATGGKLIATTMNPIAFAFDRDQLDETEFPTLRYPVPYADTHSLSPADLKAKIAKGYALEFGHSLSDIIGGQLAAGFTLVGFMESYWGDGFDVKADRMFPQYIHTCGRKPG